ncbi:unnamed protein product [Triticum turgidum subsp. durum]|uniref:E3 ubiquitin-protein ligase CHIP n=1 Tax=Triticum turgidum subsp. durum TaxID=4567 RepID=A0A9R1BQH5_TRITD|nr:unnamed protein product [Triticum turgidum subsp. durum]
MSPAADSASGSKRQAELLKQEGNTCFKKDRISAAIDAYTGVELYDHVHYRIAGAFHLVRCKAIYFSSYLTIRKMHTYAIDLPIPLMRNIPNTKDTDAYLVVTGDLLPPRSEWAKVEEDCRMAIHYDSHSVKAHYMLGLALLNRQELAGGIKALEKLQNNYVYAIFTDEPNYAKLVFGAWKGATCKEALKSYNRLDNPTADVSEEHLNELDEVFRKAAKADTPTEVPDHLCCKITLDIFRDPVITPSGITYERAVILDHLNRVGKFDPVTREPLEPFQLISNLAVKEAVDVFLKEHGWAYKIRAEGRPGTVVKSSPLVSRCLGFEPVSLHCNFAGIKITMFSDRPAVLRLQTTVLFSSCSCLSHVIGFWSSAESITHSHPVAAVIARRPDVRKRMLTPFVESGHRKDRGFGREEETQDTKSS